MKLRELECLRQLISLTHCYDEIILFLTVDNVISHDMCKQLAETPYDDRIKDLYSMMIKGQEEQRLTLMSYEWTILPNERIELLLVTPNEHRTFIYGL